MSDREKSATGQMIVKANRLVQAKMPLSRMEHRIVGAFISQLDKSDREFGYQKLYIRDLMSRSHISDQDLYSRAESICQSLLDKKLEIKRLEDGKRKYRGINLMAACEYLEGDGYIEAKFNEEMKPFLLQLKRRFTMYEAGHFMPLRSTHSMRIYELLKMREGVSVLRISVEEFREILGLQDKYEYFSHLEHHVIKKAQEEIQDKTDIHFTYDAEREGRSVERVKFFIHQSEEEEPETPRMEDRTEAPNIDVLNLFLLELSQEELDNLNKSKLESLHEQATEHVERNSPNASKTYKQSRTLQCLKTLWENH
jgi:plasmid replication initiation protein